MLVSDIIRKAELQADESYETSDWIDFINAGLDDMTPVIKLLKSKSGVVVTLSSGNGSVTISSDADLAKAHEFINVFFTPTAGVQEQLKLLPYKDNYSKGWKLTSATIDYQNCGSSSGTSKIDYYQKLQHVSLLTDDLATVAGLPEQYHELVVLFCVARSQAKEEELSDKQDVYSEYLGKKNNMSIDRIWAMEPQNRKFLRKARIAALIGGGS